MLLRLTDVPTKLSLGFRTHLRVLCAMKEDMRMRLIFLECFNGSVIFPVKQWSDSDQLQLFTDSAGASQLGCAAILGSCCSFLRWPSVWSDSAILKDITFLELVPIVLEQGTRR